jgi:hypothetical protein
VARMKLEPTTEEHQLELAGKHKQRVTHRLDHDFGIDLCVTTEMIASVKKRRRTYEALVIDGLQYLTPKDLARVVLLVGIDSLWRSYPKICV